MKSYIQRKLTRFNAKAAAVGTALALSAGTASADVATAIADAVTSGTTNVGLASSGIITVAALMLGVGVVISLLRK